MTGYALCESSRLSKEKKQIINDSEVIEEMHAKPAAADNELVRFANIEVNVERAIETHAPDLNARHRVSFIGGGKSKELRNVEDAARLHEKQEARRRE